MLGLLLWAALAASEPIPPDVVNDVVPDAASSAPAARASRLEVEGGYDGLTNGYAPWYEGGFVLAHDLFPGGTEVLNVRTTNRFGIFDQELGLAWYHAASQHLSYELSGTLSPGHQVLPAWSLTANVTAPLGFGVALAGGVTQTAYTATSVTTERVGVSQYLGAFEPGYTLYLTELAGAPLAISHVASVGYDYGEHNREQLALSVGRELEWVGPQQLLQSDVWSAALYGKTWLDARWGIGHAVGYEVFGSSYTRTSGSLSLLYAF